MNLQFNTLPEGLLVTVIGISIVFLGLVVLIMLISLINRLSGGFSKKKPAPVAAPQFTPAAPAAPAAVETNVASEDELIAVIAAAIAMMGEEGKGLVVRRVRRISNASAWNKAGREEQVYSRY